MPKTFILHTSGPSEAPKRLELTEEELTQEHKDFFFGNLLKTFDDCPKDAQERFLERLLDRWSERTAKQMLEDYKSTGVIDLEVEYWLNKDWKDRVAEMKRGIGGNVQELKEKIMLEEKFDGPILVQKEQWNGDVGIGNDVRKKLDDEILFTNTEELGLIPLFVRVKNTCLRYVKNTGRYYRDAGDWNVGISVRSSGSGDRFFTNDYALTGIGTEPMIPVSKNEWKESNKGYIPDFLDDERKPRPY